MAEYEEIETFMTEYFRDYNRYAQDDDKMPKMNRYWSEDFQSTAYFKLEDGEYPFHMPDRKSWQEFLVRGHKTVWEDLNHLDMAIDTKKLRVTSLLNVVKYSRTDDKLLASLDGIGYYTLSEDTGSLKITRLHFFTGDAGTFT